VNALRLLLGYPTNNNNGDYNGAILAPNLELAQQHSSGSRVGGV